LKPRPVHGSGGRLRSGACGPDRAPGGPDRAPGHEPL
jgi:hypothetical protein